jgi:hypothetical protein
VSSPLQAIGEGVCGARAARDCSTLAAFREVQQRGNCLKLVPARAPFELTELILALIQDHAERLRLYEDALAFARKHTFEALAQHVVKTMK